MKKQSVQSMTGYGRASKGSAAGNVAVEARSTNHRYLTIDQRLPNGVNGLQGWVAETVRKYFKRGRVEITVAVQIERAAGKRVVFDETLLERYYHGLLNVKARFGLTGGISLEHLLTLPQAISIAEDRGPIEHLTKEITETVSLAVRDLEKRRLREGVQLVRDLRAQSKTIADHVRAIKQRLPIALAQQRERLRSRIRALLGAKTQASIPHLEEALALVKEEDIHEELVRIDSHLRHLAQVLKDGGSVGKLVDFIAQELTRETNTLGAKVNDSEAAKHVIAIKSCIEKIREQAQNLE